MTLRSLQLAVGFVGVAALGAACSSTPSQPRSGPSSAALVPAAAAMAVPAESAGEVARWVLADRGTSAQVGVSAKGTRSYEIVLACAPKGGARLSYDVVVNGARLTSGGQGCDGTQTVNTVGDLRSGSTVQVNATVSEDVERAFAIVRPAEQP